MTSLFIFMLGSKRDQSSVLDTLTPRMVPIHIVSGCSVFPSLLRDSPYILPLNSLFIKLARADFCCLLIEYPDRCWVCSTGSCQKEWSFTRLEMKRHTLDPQQDRRPQDNLCSSLLETSMPSFHSQLIRQLAHFPSSFNLSSLVHHESLVLHLDRHMIQFGLPWWLRWRICLQCRKLGFNPGWGRSPGGGKQQTTPVFLPGEFHGQRSLEGYSPWDCKESDMTELLTHTWYSMVWCDIMVWYGVIQRTVHSMGC